MLALSRVKPLEPPLDNVTAPVPVKIGLVTLVEKVTALLVDMLAQVVPVVPIVTTVPPPVRLPVPLEQVKVWIRRPRCELLIRREQIVPEYCPLQNCRR